MKICERAHVHKSCGWLSTECLALESDARSENEASAGDAVAGGGAGSTSNRATRIRYKVSSKGY